jgi:hypothetical protein
MSAGGGPEEMAVEWTVATGEVTQAPVDALLVPIGAGGVL